MIGLLSAATIIVGLLQYGAVDGQLTAMREQLGEMRNARLSGDRSSADQIAQMNEQSGVMKGQLGAMEVDQRPWVGLFGIDELPSSSALRVVIVNSGRSPALEVRAQITGGFQSFGPFHALLKPCHDDCFVSDLMLLPHVLIGHVVSPAGGPEPNKPEPQWILVRVDYLDVRGRSHQTRICLIRSPLTGELRTCPEHESNFAS